MKKKYLGIILAVISIFIALSACRWTTRTGKLRTESQTIALNGAESVAVNLNMKAGELNLSGGAVELAETEFIYNVPDWQPMIDYVVSGERGELFIEQPDVGNLGLDSYRYEWNIHLNEDVPMEVAIALGAGESEIDASSLSITQLDLKVGVGGATLNLTGERERDLNVSVRGGVGEVVILLPEDVGVQAEVEGGIGEVKADGMSRKDDTYVNEAFDVSETTINLDIQGGVGGVTLDVQQ